MSEFLSYRPVEINEKKLKRIYLKLSVPFPSFPKPNVELYCIILDGIPVEPYNKYKFNINKITSPHNV